MIILREQQKNAKDVSEELWKEASEGYNTGKAFEVGIAVDIGTTTIAMTVVVLKDKKIVGQLSETNRQTSLGADVMMRIMHAVTGKREKLHQMVICQVEQMAQRILKETLDIDIEKYGSSKIHFAVVGNTTMCHLFIDKSVEGLAGYPFCPAFEGNYQCVGREIGMTAFVEARVSVLSGIAAHVGSDALAVIGAEKLYQKEKLQLAIDLGTNAEIILNQRGEVSVCSTAAGPAFEGKGIQCGKSARPGAVNGIRISSGNGNIILEYIGGKKPDGICGSGLIDAVAELRKCGVLMEDGYLLNQSEALAQGVHKELCKQLVERGGQNAFLLYQTSGSSKEIYLQQSDIRSVQLAKGAIQAGISTLLREKGVMLSELDEVIVTGVLGSCVRPVNAVRIGLLPECGTGKMRFVGNAAGKGAVRMLLDEEFLTGMEKLAKKICHVELAQMPDFQKLLVQAMNFPDIEINERKKCAKHSET